MWKAHANYSLRDPDTKPSLIWRDSNSKPRGNLMIRDRESPSSYSLGQKTNLNQIEVPTSTNIKPRPPNSNKRVFDRDLKIYSRAPALERTRIVATANSRTTLAADEDDAVLFIFGRGITGGIVRRDAQDPDIRAITRTAVRLENAVHVKATTKNRDGRTLRGVLFAQTDEQIDYIRREIREGVLGPIRIDRHRFTMVHRAAGHWTYDADLRSRSVRQIWEGSEGDAGNVTPSSGEETSSDSGSPRTGSTRTRVHFESSVDQGKRSSTRTGGSPPGPARKRLREKSFP